MSSPSPVTAPDLAPESPANKANSPPATDSNHEEAPSSPAKSTTVSASAESAADLNPKEPGTESPSAEPADLNPKESKSEISSNRSTPEPGQIDETEDLSAPPLPSEPLPNQLPILPDDGWEPKWNDNDSSWWFYNRFTGIWQLDNPRVPADDAATMAPPPIPVVAPPSNTDPTAISDLTSVAGGYNPAIHGSYDPNAWYAQNSRAAAAQEAASQSGGAGANPHASGGFFNRQTGQWQAPEQGAERHSDDSKSRRQMNAFFDVDAAANMHDGRSLKAERSGKKPTKTELKAFKEKRKARKEEKRRAWLRD